MSAEEPEPVHRARSKGGLVVVMGLLLISFLYILSPPFAYLLVGEPLVSNPVCRVIYYPLTYLSREFPLVRDFYMWYSSLFPWVP